MEPIRMEDIMQRGLRLLMPALAALLGNSTAIACDLDAGQMEAYIASIDITGLNYQQQVEKVILAKQKFHDMKMREARAMFIGRFKLDRQDASAGLAARQ
jgi:hypothetical protein